MFAIEFVKGQRVDSSMPITLGRIRVGAFEERFEITLEYWTASQYVRQWREEVQRILDGDNVTCLLTSIHDPATANFFFWWPLYRLHDDVQVRNELLTLDDLSEPFDLGNPYRFVRPRETATEDGHKISEWQTTVDDLHSWLHDK